MTLREYRLAAGMTQVQLAAELGIDRTYLGKMESGLKRVPAQVVDTLAWRYGWLIVPRQPRTEYGRKRMHIKSGPTLSLESQAEMIALVGMVALAAKGEEIPRNWQDRWHNRRLWERGAEMGLQVWRQVERGRTA